MRTMSKVARLCAAAAAVALVSSGAAAAPSVSILSASRTGDIATVSGVASFPPITTPESVGGDVDPFEEPELATAAGIGLIDAKILPLANGTGLRFVWVLRELPPVVPPEGVRYTWAFKIGSSQYQLQAKRTNLASATTAEDPINHVLQAPKGSYFQLRGACVPNYLGAPVSGCYHLAFLNGNFDVENGLVTVDLPFSTRDQIGRLVAPDFVPGAVLQENVTAGMSIAASFQAVVSNTNISQFINGWDPYFTRPTVDLGAGRANLAPFAISYTTSAALAPDGSFTGSVPLDAGATTVYVRACLGVGCSSASVTP